MILVHYLYFSKWCNGAVIDMQGFQGVVFNVNPKVNGVTIKNLTIKNVCHDSLSSAIYFDSDDGSVIDCTFINNSAKYAGAVLFFQSGKLINCTFINNSATMGHGAVQFRIGVGDVTNCTFINNRAAEDCGALYIFEGTVTNCTFTNNKANGKGGAIHIQSSNVIN